MTPYNAAEIVEIGDRQIGARVSLLGAELVSLHLCGQERLWGRDPQWWASSAPLLFPVIGRCLDAQISIDGKSVPMEMHGFLSRRHFTLVDQQANSLVVESKSDAETFASYPFAHSVRVTAQLTVDGISMISEIRNHDDRTMPFCFGYHPAFPWPQGEEREKFVCRFAETEAPMIRRTDGATGLLTPPLPSPLEGRTLRLRDSLFSRGIQFEDVRSRSVWFGKAGSPGTMVSFPDSHQLAIWSKPGAPFLSIEPWQGFTQEPDRENALEKRHGVRFLGPGRTEQYRLRLSFDMPDPGA